MSSYHSRMMNIPCGHKGMPVANWYKIGHKDARHAAAEIANEADAEIEKLRDIIAEQRLTIGALNMKLGGGTVLETLNE